MKLIIEPKITEYEELSKRPELDYTSLEAKVAEIFSVVKLQGDQALKQFAEKFDSVSIDELIVSPEEIKEAILSVSEELKQAIDTAKSNIEKFHNAQMEDFGVIETMPGVNCWRKSVGIEKVGIYIPGGTAPLFSTVLMLAVPAKLAACKEIVLCTPPNKEGKINPAILYAADLCGVKTIVKAGGAQAIAAMTFGTESVIKVNKIFGPGNQYVTSAKQMSTRYGIAIDMPAGPSEVLVYADDSCEPEFVAADLLSQAEHGNDSQVILVCSNQTIAKNVERELKIQLEVLARKNFASNSLENSKTIIISEQQNAIEFINYYAPEHLILACSEASLLAEQISNAGSVFIGNYTPESAGDYASGTNHTLPTNGYARNYSGVSLDSFVKKITFQEITPQGLKNIGRTIEVMAEAEELTAHKNAVSIRLNKINNV
ncbi:MAG: histidinol dehydrogenase [Bacteroidetes bacterium]|nr:histidinol dehydrogenase [Bacteroidota bacterium]